MERQQKQKQIKQENIDKKRFLSRGKVLIGIGLCIWIGLVGRLFYIQVLSHDDLALASASQYQVIVEGMDTRGVILDRHMNPLTGGTQQYYYFILKSREDPASEKLVNAISAKEISGKDSRYSVYRSQIFDETVNQRLKDDYGAYVYCCPSRYSDDQTACHLIGYLNQAEKKGVSGLELLCEDRLKADNSKLALWADSGGNLLLGIPPKRENNQSITDNSVATTIDKEIQKICEAALKERNLSGAVLVSEAKSGDILAWASSPSFNPNAVEDYLSSSGDSLVNKCIQGAYAPGSVFKTVVAAAALEKGICDPDDEYKCKGKVKVEGVVLGCKAGPAGGHGKVDLYEAMAKSCNCYFAKLGEKLGYKDLLEMAEKMGFGQKVLDGFSEEVAGNLPSVASSGQWDISNLSIGQGEILATPMQIQKMMSIVANGGVYQEMTVFKNQGSESKSERIISEETAEELEKMLGMVMTEGTGSGKNWRCQVYGKTGTAEAVLGEQEVNNCWFSGYCKMNHSTYVVTVLIEKGQSGSASALPVFEDITEYLCDKNYVLS